MPPRIEEVAKKVRLGSDAAQTFTAFLIVFLFAAIGVTLYSGVTRVEPGEIAIIVNNITHKVTLDTRNGIKIHLPLGLTDVYKLDRTLQVFAMTGEYGTKAGDDSIRIKTNDGSNVIIDAEINYQIDETRGKEIVEMLGRGDRYKGELLRSYSRSLIRDSFGDLSIDEVTDPANRLDKIHQINEALNKSLSPWALQVAAVSATNFAFNDQYTQMIKERKESEQVFRNQESAQQNALRDQERQIAEATRIKNTRLEEEKGSQQKRIIEKQGWGEQLKKRADGDAYKARVEGEQAYQVALNEAKAVEVEGLKKAEGIQKLSDAYAQGGLGLVREALAAKYAGAVINGRPYSLDNEVQRLQLENAPAAIRGAPPAPPQSPTKGEQQ
ncbi:MAG: SPFH domain-containing protein [bacterium]